VYEDLKKTTMVTFFDMIDQANAWPLIERWNKQDKTVTWRPISGRQSVTHFMGFDELRKLSSFEIGSAFLDEVQEIKPELYSACEQRLSSPQGPRRLWCAGNPNGRDLVIWAHYHEDGPQHSDLREYFVVTSLENPFLPEDYIETLLTMPDLQQQRYIYGEFVVFEGVIYPSFSRKIHVIEPFVVDPAWRITRVIDYGMSHNPSVCLWFASDFEGNHFCIKEASWKNKIIEEVAEGIHELSSGMNIWRTYGDPSMFKMQQQDKLTRGYRKVSDLFRDEKILIYPASGDMKTRFDRTNTMLFVNPRRQNPVTGEWGSPALFVFGTCERTIDEISSRQWDKKLYSEKPKEGIPDDHVDCVEYFCNTDPRATEKPVPKDHWVPEPAGAFANWLEEL
jgi:PBSX family phage terminase large subunit